MSLVRAPLWLPCVDRSARRWRRPTAVLLAALVALLVAACVPPPGVGSREPVTVKVAILPNLAAGPMLIAQEEGYFAEQRLRVEFVRITRSGDIVPALIQKQVAAAGIGMNFATFNAMANGIPLRYVADKAYQAADGCTSNALIARRELVESGALESPAQLKGRRIAVSPTSNSGYFVQRALATAGLTLADVQIVDLPDSALGVAFQQDAVDLGSVLEPQLTQLVDDGHSVVWMGMEQIAPNFSTGLIVYGPTLLDGPPDVGERLMVGYLKGVRQYSQGKTDRNLEILARNTDLERDFLAQLCWPSFHRDGHINLQSVLEFQDWALKAGHIDARIPPEQFWDPHFIEHANSAIGAAAN